MRHAGIEPANQLWKSRMLPLASMTQKMGRRSCTFIWLARPLLPQNKLTVDPAGIEPATFCLANAPPTELRTLLLAFSRFDIKRCMFATHFGTCFDVMTIVLQVTEMLDFILTTQLTISKRYPVRNMFVSIIFHDNSPYGIRTHFFHLERVVSFQ